MHISDLDHVQLLEQGSTIAGGESPLAEIFKARLNALREEVSSASEQLVTRSTNSSGANSTLSRATGGSFSKTIVSVFPPDISGIIIDAEIPES